LSTALTSLGVIKDRHSHWGLAALALASLSTIGIVAIGISQSTANLQ